MIVEGHTDNIPLRPDAQFETNWELSTARLPRLCGTYRGLGSLRSGFPRQDMVSIAT